MAKQLSLGVVEKGRNWGGARKGAGRKCGPGKTTAGVAHRTREEHIGRYPIHVTLRARGDVPSLRQGNVLHALYRCFARARARGRGFVHFSLQKDHLHLLMEARDRHALARTVKGFASATARAFNRVLGRRGALWEERYHRHDLRTPTEVRHALAYVLHNARKHARSDDERERRGRGLDPYSSAAWFDGWDAEGTLAARELERALAQRGFTQCTAAPRTFLLMRGWARLGPIACDHVPAGRSSSMHFAAPPGPTSRCST